MIEKVSMNIYIMTLVLVNFKFQINACILKCIENDYAFCGCEKDCIKADSMHMEL